MPLGLREPLHAPALAREGLLGGADVVGDVPIGAHHSVVARLLPEQILNQVFVVGVAHVLPTFLICVIGDGVVGHDSADLLGGSVQGESPPGEGLQVLVKVAAGVHGVLAVGVVGVPPALACAAAGEVLHHGVDAVLPPAVPGLPGGLEAVAVCLCHVDGHLGMLPEGVAQAHPPGLGGQADAVGPFGDGFSGDPHILRHGARSVPGVGAVVGGDAEAGPLRQRLEGAVPEHRRLGALQAHDEHVAHLVLRDEFLLLVGEVPGLGSALLIGLAVVGALEGRRQGPLGRDELVGAVEHQTRDVLNGQAFCQSRARSA